jgi:maltokinase
MTPVSTTGRPVAGRSPPDDDVVRALRSWLPHQRWYPAKGTAARPQRVSVIELRDPADEATVQLHLFRLPTGVVLQVPTTLRGPEYRGPGTIAPVAPGTLVDGPEDPAFARAWLAAADTDGTAPVVDLTGLRRLGSEQSNTSVVLPALRPPAILKIFRVVTAGPNPDVDVPLALARSGWAGVPRPIAWLAGAWPGATSAQVGHLGVLSELVSDAQDGFELACEHASGGRDFGDLAAALGRTLVQMHHALRVALPVGPRTSPQTPLAAVHEVTRLLRERARAAADEIPALAARLPGIERVLADVADLAAVPPLQRVHGDLHLGQVLLSTDGSWYVLDFEGEPLASAAEKARPDLALRDVAGMLRSIDYAAAIGKARSPEWASSARSRLVAGYRSQLSTSAADPVTDRLLQVLELDKAVYEVVYESRNRPGWVAIPLGGVDRLLRAGG